MSPPPANPCSPLPHQSDVSTWAEYYALVNRRLFGYQSSCRLLLLLICGNKASSWFWCIIEIIAFLLALPLWLQRNAVKHLGVVFPLQKHSFVPVVDSEVDFAVSAVTRRISHLDEHLQRRTNGPTSPYCLLNKRDEVTDNLPRPASKRLMNSEGTNKNQERRRVSPCNLAQSFNAISRQRHERKWLKLKVLCVVYETKLKLKKHNSYNIDEVTMHTHSNIFFHWINKPSLKENKVTGTLFEARKAAGSATYKQSKSEWNSAGL